jgi:hypothetical protein
MLAGGARVHAKAPDDVETTPTDDADCPLGTRWVSWTLARLVNRGHVSPEECEAVLRARQETGWRAATTLQAAWSIGRGDDTRTPDAPGFLVRRRHAHTTLSIAGRSVHIDWTTGTSYGPLSSYSMVRIYVGGALRNETVQGGSSLGYTVWGDRILAVLDPTTAIRVGPIRFSDTASPRIWVMAPSPAMSRAFQSRRVGRVSSRGGVADV